MHLGLAENDGQGPESQQGGHTEESVDPQSCALFRNLVADQKVVSEGGKVFLLLLFLFFHGGKGNKKGPKLWPIPLSSPHQGLQASTFPWPHCYWGYPVCGALLQGMLAPALPSRAQRY